jgi:hypothetical protein
MRRSLCEGWRDVVNYRRGFGARVEGGRMDVGCGAACV